jgi:hypothetical protein
MAARDTAMDAAMPAMERRFAELEASHARTVAAKDAAVADLRAALVNLERDNSALRADAAAQLKAIHTAVTSNLALEIRPVRADGLHVCHVARRPRAF